MSVATPPARPAPALLQPLLRARQIDASLPPAAWLELIPGLLAFERRRASLASRYRWSALALFALGFVSCVAGKAGDHGSVVGFAWLLFGVALLVALLGGKLSGGPKLPVGDLTGCMKPLVSLLAHDLEPRRPLALRLDLHDGLGGATSLSEFRDLPKPYSNKRHLKVEERLLRIDRFSGSGRLRNGGQLRWQVVDQVRERRIRKKGSSGKMKVATKQRVKRLLEVQLSVRSLGLQTGETLPAGVRIRAGARRSVVRARAVRIVAGPPPPLDLKEILDLMTAAFRPTLGRAQKGEAHGRV